MSPRHHYLYDKSDIILSKTDGFTVSMQMSVWQQSVLWVDIVITVARSGAFGCVQLTQHISLEITTKRCFHFIRSAYYWLVLHSTHI